MRGSEMYFRKESFPLYGVPYDYTSLMQYNSWVSGLFACNYNYSCQVLEDEAPVKSIILLRIIFSS